MVTTRSKSKTDEEAAILQDNNKNDGEIQEKDLDNSVQPAAAKKRDVKMDDARLEGSPSLKKEEETTSLLSPSGNTVTAVAPATATTPFQKVLERPVAVTPSPMPESKTPTSIHVAGKSTISLKNKNDAKSKQAEVLENTTPTNNNSRTHHAVTNSLPESSSPSALKPRRRISPRTRTRTAALGTTSNTNTELQPSPPPKRTKMEKNDDNDNGTARVLGSQPEGVAVQQIATTDHSQHLTAPVAVVAVTPSPAASATTSLKSESDGAENADPSPTSTQRVLLRRRSTRAAATKRKSYREDNDDDDDDETMETSKEESEGVDEKDDDFSPESDPEDELLVDAEMESETLVQSNKQAAAPASVKRSSTRGRSAGPITPKRKQTKKKETSNDNKSSPGKKAFKTKGVKASPSPPTAKAKSSASTLLSRRIDKWGLPRGALAKCPSTGFTIRALDTIPPNANRTQLLPGRLLVIAVDDQQICPSEFLNVTFDSAQALHSAISDWHKNNTAATAKIPKILFATYGMEAVADPAFAPWEFAMARMESTGFVANDEEGNDENGVLQVIIHWDGGANVSGDVTYWKRGTEDVDDNLQWTFLEGDQLRNVPPVLLGAPKLLLDYSVEQDLLSDQNDTNSNESNEESTSYSIRPDLNLLPQPANKGVFKVKLAASLLQKSLRRGKNLCSLSPLLEACRDLIHPSHACRGSTFAFLRTLWSCMLVDAAPFSESSDCLGLGGALLLSLIAKANPTWAMPPTIRRYAMSSAIRTAQCQQTQQWIGFVEPNDNWWRLEEITAPVKNPAHTRASNLRNTLRAAQAVAGGRIIWGKWNKFLGDPSAAAILAYLNFQHWNGSYLPDAPSADQSEPFILDAWEKGETGLLPPESQKLLLDQECRLAAVEPNVMPQTLVLLQAVLELPPTNWKKHGLPSLSRQVRKLISEANPRFRERQQLARLETWGKEKAAVNGVNVVQAEAKIKVYHSSREVVTPTGILSEGETKVVDCFESVQRWQLKYTNGNFAKEESANDSTAAQKNVPLSIRRIKAGPDLTEYDGRIAFLLAFARAIEVNVNGEVVSAMFCGNSEEPLLVQRIGKARKEGQELATGGGSTSGATAVPSLGYVQRRRSKEEADLMEAAEVAVAAYWNGGISMPLPLPPPGFQWEVPNTTKNNANWDGGSEEVELVAKFCPASDGANYWEFSIGGVKVAAFDARSVISPCALSGDDNSHPLQPIDVGSNLDLCLRTALYALPAKSEDTTTECPLPQGEEVLSVMMDLHNFAVAERAARPDEGLVYDWMGMAVQSRLPARVWRDALLAIRTRDADHVQFGKGISQDGSGAPRDMTEGVLVRIFHALECLYPMALRKEGAFKFRVRPQGASFYHLLRALQLLGRGEAISNTNKTSPETIATPSKTRHTSDKEDSFSSPKTRRTSDKEDSFSSRVASQATNSTNKRRKALDIPAATKPDNSSLPPAKRPRRQAAIAASRKLSIQKNSDDCDTGQKKAMDDDFNLADEESHQEDDNLDGSGMLVEGETSTHQRYHPLLPTVTTDLWDHQESSAQTVVEGVKEGKRGHADASAVGAGKTLTALATVIRLAKWLHESEQQRHGVLVMLPTKALIREWLLEIATHTKGFHVIEQREDGTLFSLTYSKTNPPIDANSLIITTLDRVCRHPFVKQKAWDMVVIDECLSVQNADAKRVPSAWRQIEISTCGVLMLSATFFRSKYDALFYMIRMLRSPFPRTMEWLPATIHEHIVCQIPETGRSWQMKGELVPLAPLDLVKYRRIIETFQRRQINKVDQADGRKLWLDLETFVRKHYEGRAGGKSYASSSIMGDAFAKLAKNLLRKKRRPLVFADTSTEAEFILRSLRNHGLDGRTWSSIANDKIAGISSCSANKSIVIVAVKTVEGQGINMQHHADTIICRPTPGDHLEQMKGRIDRPGQRASELHLHVLVCEHTIEEAKFANIRLAGNFFREYIAPVASRYKERIDLKATLAAGGTSKLKRGTVAGAWKRELEEAGQSGCFASVDMSSAMDEDGDAEDMEITNPKTTGKGSTQKKEEKVEQKYKPLNKVIRNKGDRVAVREAKEAAKRGGVSPTIYNWLFPSNKPERFLANPKHAGKKALPKESPLRFSNRTPAVVLDAPTIQKAVSHLTKNDPKLGALIARIGPDALVRDCGQVIRPTQARLFDRCLRAITFTMVSVDAGNAFLRRLAIKVGVCLENLSTPRRSKLLIEFRTELQLAARQPAMVKSPEQLLEILLRGGHNEITFTPSLVGELVQQCEIINGKRSGYPHLCGVSFVCGKHDDPGVFLGKARDHAKAGKDPVSAGYSAPKAGFIVSLVDDFAEGRISGEKIAQASDREAFKMLIGVKGLGDWCVGGILMHFLSRADVMLYGDLTVRNYLNELYDINHNDSSETLVESAADFADNAVNRNLIDEVSKKNGWEPYRSVVCYLMYHLQEENLVLL